MTRYKHLSYEEREKIAQLRQSQPPHIGDCGEIGQE